MAAFIKLVTTRKTIYVITDRNLNFSKRYLINKNGSNYPDILSQAQAAAYRSAAFCGACYCTITDLPNATLEEILKMPNELFIK